MHDLGKGATPAEILPSHPGHEDAGVALVERLAARLRVPNQLRELAVITARFHTHVHRALELRPDTVLRTLENCDALRRPERFADMLLACEADALGRGGPPRGSYPQRAFFAAARDRAAAVMLTDEERRGMSGEQIGQELRRRRLAAIEELRKNHPQEAR
jgi:tRNA nucleotidyltransferase (CCA-adding enzyme)